MVQLFSEIDKEYLEFFNKGFVTKLGFYVSGFNDKFQLRYADKGNAALLDETNS